MPVFGNEPIPATIYYNKPYTLLTVNLYLRCYYLYLIGHCFTLL